jgi:hypothetical protein
MDVMQIEILNPKANLLLKNLASMNLISITSTKEDGFLELVNRIRSKAKHKAISMEEITEEVEIVRAERNAKRKK